MKKMFVIAMLAVLVGCTNGANMDVSAEEDQYAEYISLVACDLISAGLQQDQVAAEESLSKNAMYAEQVGLSNAEIESLNEKYKNDEEFVQLVDTKMRVQCPEVYDTLDS